VILCDGMTNSAYVRRGEEGGMEGGSEGLVVQKFRLGNSAQRRELGGRMKDGPASAP